MPLAFDAAELAAEVARLPANAWQAHFNTAIYDGDWSGIALRSTGGAVPLYSDPRPGAPWTDTPMLDACPGLRSALAVFACPLTSVRLLRVGEGATVREHRDYQIGFDAGEIRLHVPITTDAAISFELAGRAIAMVPGECWYIDVTRPHRVTNSGRTPRIHLVIDCVVDDWLRHLFARAMSDGFDRFRELVETDAGVRAVLRHVEDPEEFAALAARLGADRGLPFDAERVHAAIRDGRLRWFDHRNR